jgi:dihydroorotate dehydrogenase (fumarate)
LWQKRVYYQELERETLMDLTTKYLGLKLRNPLVAGSSGLTADMRKIKELEENGAGAVVLKSIFEEEIALEYDKVLEEITEEGFSRESYDYYDYEIRANRLGEYTKLIGECRKNLSIPFIASVNCSYSHEWVSFAKELEKAGANALELNMFFLPSDLTRSREEQEQAYLKVVEKIVKTVSIPVALKISCHFSSLGAMIKQLSGMGIAGLVLFNRFFQLDFDIEKLKVVPAHTLSTQVDAALPLRWIAIMANRVGCDLAASGGVHDGKGLAKMLLAGAKAVQVVSAIYRNGAGHIKAMLEELEEWMGRRGYGSIESFRGKMSQAASENPAAYERVQFMKYFGGGEWSLR